MTHEIGFARQVADRIVFMAGGRILEVAPPEEFFARTRHPEARAFMAKALG